ncbi:hypothetical protein ACF0H5_000802 [Mactra antiquata]
MSTLSESQSFAGPRRTALIAGDSNVHRIRRMVDPRSGVSCLPVSGARFTKDRKDFIRQLLTEMKREEYEVLYLHLGSNDVLCPLEDFTRSVADLCKSVHDVSLTCKVVLCEILQRDMNWYGKWLSRRTVNLFNTWILEANEVLKSFIQPNVTFLSYGSTFMTDLYLCPDGLHLSEGGSRVCQRAIFEHWQREVKVSNLLVSVHIPALAPAVTCNTCCQTQSASVTVSQKKSTDVVVPQGECVDRYCTGDHIKVSVTADVAVFLKASKIQGFFRSYQHHGNHSGVPSKKPMLERKATVLKKYKTNQSSSSGKVEFHTKPSEGTYHSPSSSACIRQRLLLANDVEQNPGPDKSYFPSIDAWFSTLPNRIIDKESTNLSFCPQKLRYKLKIPLFDEDFMIPTIHYTLKDHEDFIKKLSSFNPKQYIDMTSIFISKRTALGENWDSLYDELKHLGNKDFEQPLDQMAKENELVPCIIPTTRPELSSNSCLGTKLINEPKKRKHDELLAGNDFVTPDSNWTDVLLNNLSKCSDVLQLMPVIESLLLNDNLVSAKKQSFIRLEHEAAKLGSTENCTSGTFVCFVFRFSHEGKDIFYVRYIESGVYIGFMLQTYIHKLQDHFDFSENVVLHNVITVEDIEEMRCNHTLKKSNLKRDRPDKTYEYCTENILPPCIKDLNDINCSEIPLVSSLIHCLPHKVKISIDSPQKVFFHQTSNAALVNLDDLMVDFRLNQVCPMPVLSSDFYSKPITECTTLLQQSINLNVLSGDTKKTVSLFTRDARFPSNFSVLARKNHRLASSLRIVTTYLYNQYDIGSLISFYRLFFPDLGNHVGECKSISLQPPAKKKRTLGVVNRISVLKDNLKKKLLPSDSDFYKTEQLSLFQRFCCSLLEHGTLYFQSFQDPENFICILNDYSETDGSFRPNDYVFTQRSKLEIGDYYYCSCAIYRTLLDINGAQSNSHLSVLEYSDPNNVTCLHCKFLKEKVMPNLSPDSNASTTRIQQFIQSALRDLGSNVIDLGKQTNSSTRKFSVLADGEDHPSFVHIYFNKRLNRNIISCLNGRCKSLRGHKKKADSFLTADVCKHLSIMKTKTHLFNDLIGIDDNNNNCVEEDSFELIDESSCPSNEPIANIVGEFNEDTGLWDYNCVSKHSPVENGCKKLRINVNNRDLWNDVNFERYTDGSLKGPNLFPDMPDNTCPCGAGWLLREDDVRYNSQGLLRFGRCLTVYTLANKVKCDIFNRICYNSERPCVLEWDEGEKDCIHVLSSVTAAGDEIGWTFVESVKCNGCTFSSFCHLKTQDYRFRHPNARFMDPTVFLKWWFSWASNMKINFIVPCDVCGFQPKRLCCDGTRVGVGFRNANFEEVSKPDDDENVQQTLHRRLDRCFLTNMNGVNKQEMIRNRYTLNYLARKQLGDISNTEIMSDEDLRVRITAVRHVLNEQILPSFDRFFNMKESEKSSYAQVLKMLSSTASISSLLPPSYVSKLQQLLFNPYSEYEYYGRLMTEMRYYAPELRDLISTSVKCNNSCLAEDIRSFLQYLVNEVKQLPVTESDPAVPQPGTYNPGKYGIAYYFNKDGLKLRNIRKFTIDHDNGKKNLDHDDAPLDFERCQKQYSKFQLSAPGTSTLFLWFCADHGHCYGFHMTNAEGRKDPSASLYSYLEKPPSDVFYDFACNLQEYCLNRENVAQSASELAYNISEDDIVVKRLLKSSTKKC